ncbi:hypothetical protein [Streptococcus sanguinis]|uniref:Uncharacterized protein n=1 Tax=Streptococcus sanguinis TaxID=1305 RepID=A0AAE8KB41_STRSA|nr:hypothetical protein [Streptococcus sanguinis]RSI09810.1 hypothetical protein D8888_02630 [Streptococcus sanguinis]
MIGLFKRDKEKLKNDADKCKYLKILSFEEDLKQRKKSIEEGARTSAIIFLLLLFVFILLSFLISQNSYKKPVIGLLGLVLILQIFYFIIQWINRWLLVQLLGRLKKFSSMIIFTIIYIESLIVSFLWWFIAFLKNGDWMYSNFRLNCFIFILSIIFTLLQTKAALKYHPSYLVELLYAPIVTVLAIISLLPYFWEPQIIEPKNMLQLFISWAIVLSVVTMTLIQIYLENKSSKNEETAQEIFQEQLLKNEDDIDYNRLVECYYYGGEKYKEKLLSTEKFLRLIKKRESI